MSFGQRQRLAIVRALCQSFEYILLDEAFSHLDATNTKIAWELIKEEAGKQNAGIILTSLNKEFDNEMNKIRV
jgi:ABC-type multidrug transport system ATPase subunit